MPWTRPTLSDLYQRALANFVARLPGADLTLRRAVITVTSKTIAGIANGVYGYLDYLIDQPFADKNSAPYLYREGAMYGLYPNGAVKAAGNVTVTGLDGATIPTDTVLFLHQPTGLTFRTQASATISGGTATVPVIAESGGVAGNLATSAPLTLIYALPSVNATAAVAAPGLTGGADAESVAAFRSRVLARKRQPPQGGIATDYVNWALAVPGVTRAWAYPRNRGAGTVDLSFVMDGRANIIPLSGDVTAVQAAIDAKRPVTDDCVVFAPVSTAVPFSITGPFTAAQKAGITAALADMFTADAMPGGAYDPASGGTFTGGLSYQDQIVPAVAQGAGDAAFNITVPSADIAGVAGHILIPGTITWS